MRWPLAMCGMTLVVLSSGCHASKCDHVERSLRPRLRSLRDACGNGSAGLLQQGPPDRGPQPSRRGATPARDARATASAPAGRSLSHPGTGDRRLRQRHLFRRLGAASGAGARDCDDHVVKVPAAARILVLEITEEGTKKPLSEWDVSPEQFRASYRQGLFGSGYTLILSWKVYPSTTKPRVIAKLLTADGRVLEAEKDVTVKLVPPGQRRMPAAPDGKPEDPFFPSGSGDPAPANPKPGQPGPLEKLPTPKPVDFGPALPPPPGKSAESTDWGPMLPATSTSGWGPPRRARSAGFQLLGAAGTSLLGPPVATADPTGAAVHAAAELARQGGRRRAIG